MRENGLLTLGVGKTFILIGGRSEEASSFVRGRLALFEFLKRMLVL